MCGREKKTESMIRCWFRRKNRYIRTSLVQIAFFLVIPSVRRRSKTSVVSLSLLLSPCCSFTPSFAYSIEQLDSNPTAPEVLKALQQRKTSWNVPEDRVGKSIDEVNLTRRGEFVPPTQVVGGSGDADEDSVRSGLSRGSAASAAAAAAGKTATKSPKPAVTRFDRRKMHFVAPQKAKPRRAGSRGSTATTGTADTTCMSDHSSSDHTGDEFFLPEKGGAATNAMEEGKPVAQVPPKRPQRTYSDDSDDAGNDNAADTDDEDGDADIIEEANRRSKFIMKGGSHSIQKVLKGEARKKKGFSRFDRRSIKAAGNANAEDESESSKPAVGSDVLQALGDSYSESVAMDDLEGSDAEEFAAEVARRSKFIAKGGSHSIKKVLAGEARSGGKKSTGPSRINRRNIPSVTKQVSKDDDDESEEVVIDIPEDVKKTKKTPLRSISIDSTDSQIEDEATRRSRFMLKGASHSIRNLLSGKAKKEKRGSQLDRRKMKFHQQANAVHYSEETHKKPEEINQARLKAEAEARERAAARKAARSTGGSTGPRRPVRKTTQNDLDDGEQPPAKKEEIVEDDDDDDADIEAEVGRRSHMFKGGSHSIRNLFSGKSKKKESGGSSGIGRFNRRKMHFQKEAKAVHSNEKPRQTPAQINARHQQEADRLRAEDGDSQPPDQRTSTTSTGSSKLELGQGPESKKGVFSEIDALHGEDADALPACSDDDLDDEDREIVEEVNRRSSFMGKGGSYSIQKVLKGEARKTKGVTRFDRRKMHFKHESEAVHCHDNDAKKDKTAGAKKAPAAEAAKDSSDDESDLDPELLEEANKRSMFFMKGGSHSIQKVIRGEARVKKTAGVNRFDRRKLQAKQEPKDVKGAQSLKSRKASPDSGEKADPDSDSDIDADDDIIEEANKRSKFMMKGGSYSIQKVLRGEARTKKEGVTRFDRRKMHFKHEGEALHSHDNDAKSPTPNDHAAKAPKRKPSSGANLGDDDCNDDDSSEFDEEELALLAEAEADPRRQMMLKGTHSIRNIFSGKAKKKEKTGAGMERRKSQLKNASIRTGLNDESERLKGSDDEPSVQSEKSPVPDKSIDRRSKFTLKGASNSIRNLLGRKSGKQKAMDAEIERLQKENDEGADDIDLDAELDDLDDDDMDEEDREIMEEVDRRSSFMGKGGSYSIQKVLKGEARKTKGITRFDRRKMHFKHESEAIHSHDNDGKQGSEKPAPSSPAEEASPDAEKKDPVAEPIVTTDVEEDLDDAEDYEDLDDEDREIMDEVDRRSSFMGKGGSYSIQKVLKGEARKTKGVTRFDRRKMHFKHESEAIHSHDHDGDKETVDDKPAVVKADKAPSKPPSRPTRSAPALKLPARPRAAPALRKPAASAANAKAPARRVSSDGDGRADSAEASPKETEATIDDGDDDDDEDDEALGEEVDRRSRFTLKGASHSIKKVLAGKARTSKKDAGLSRLDRRRIQLKSKATPSADMDVPSPAERSSLTKSPPGKSFLSW